MGGLGTAGVLRDSVVVLKESRVADGSGGWITTFVAQAPYVRAEKLSARAPQDLIVAGQARNHEYAEWHLDRRLSGKVTGSHRILDREGRFWDVLAVEQQDDLIFATCRDVINKANCPET